MKLARLVILVAILGAFTGCTYFVTPSPTSTPTATLPPSPAPSPTPTPTPLPSLVTLTLWVPDFLNPYDETTGAALMLEQLEAFTLIQPDVQIQIIVKKASGTGGLYNMLSAAYTAAPAILPDLIILSQNDLNIAVGGGYVQPLDDTLVNKADFFPFARVQTTITGTFGIPFVTSTDHTAYRSGVSATPPFSWTDVITNNYSLLIPAAPANDLADDALLAAYLGAGGSVMDESGKPKLERTALEDLYAFFAEMISHNLLSPERVLLLPDAAACWETFQQGIGRMTAVSAGLYWANPSQGIVPGWMPTPSGAPIALAHTWTMAMVTSDPFRQEAALQLMQWLTAPEQAATLTRETRLLPTRYHAVELWGLLPEQTAFLQTLLDSAVPSFPPNVEQPVRRALQAGLRALLNGDVTTAEEAATYAISNLR